MEEEERLLTFQPVIDPLQALTKESKIDTTQTKQLVLSYKPGPSTPSRIPFLASIPAPRTLDFGLVASQYLGNYLYKSNTTDNSYGISREYYKFFIGNKPIEIANDDILIDDKVYKGTLQFNSIPMGLWELLTLNQPKEYSIPYLETYKEILESTNGLLKGYKDNASISSSMHYKYSNLIKPLFSITGGVMGIKIDYIYWDDPNELVSRLRLLWLSREAGNTSVDNKIDSIIEELQECGIIS